MGSSRPDGSRWLRLVRSAASAWRAFDSAYPRLGALLPGVALVVLGLGTFLATLDSVQEQDDLMVVDEPVLLWLADNRTGIGDTVLHAITLISGPIVLPALVCTACLAWGLMRRRWWRPLLLLETMAVAALISLAVKQGVARPRPPLDSQYIPGAETTFSFPSGHTIVTAALCLVGGYLVWSRRATLPVFLLWMAGAFLATAAVGLSRLYLGYHFVTDVVAAIGLAVLVLGLVVMVDRYRGLKKGVQQPPTGPGPG